MRWRCAAGNFHRSAVFSRRTSALLHLTIRSPESDGSSESHLKRGIQPIQPASFQIDPIHAVMEVVLPGRRVSGAAVALAARADAGCEKESAVLSEGETAG